MQSQTAKNFLPIPSKLVSNGQLQYGIYNRPFPCVNMLDANLGRLRWFGLKQWQHFALGNERFFLNLAIFDSKRINLMQLEVYDRETDAHIKFEKQFVHRNFELADALFKGRSHCRVKGLWIDIENNLSDGNHRIRFGADMPGRPVVEGAFEIQCNLKEDEPLVVCLPFEGDRGMYSHKGVFPASGWLRIGDTSHTLGNGFGLPDIHKGYYPRRMTWHWGTAAGYTDKGDLIGFNLTRNQALKPEIYNENAFWLNGKVHRLPAVQFELSLEDGDGQARAYDKDGSIDLQFSTAVSRRVDMNMIIARSRYRGPYGLWTGSIKVGRKKHQISLFGMAEDMLIEA